MSLILQSLAFLILDQYCHHRFDNFILLPINVGPSYKRECFDIHRLFCVLYKQLLFSLLHSVCKSVVFRDAGGCKNFFIFCRNTSRRVCLSLDQSVFIFFCFHVNLDIRFKIEKKDSLQN